MVVETLRRFMETHEIGPCTVIAAFSGGIDSTALTLALSDVREEGFAIVCGHVNHHLRGEEADADEEFVRGLCRQLGVPLEVADGTLPDELVRHRGIEAAAREIREAALQRIRRAHDARFIATAHQQNDQAETVLMRLFTGSGIAGLRGIHPVRDDGFIRPLLDLPRSAIERFLDERGVIPRIDRMNDDPRFLRTRIRRMLVAFGPPAVERIAAAAAEAHAAWEVLERAVDRESAVDETPDATLFRSWPDDPFLRRLLLRREIARLDSSMREISSADLERLTMNLSSIRRTSVTKSLELERVAGNVVLRRRRSPTAAYEHPLAVGEPLFVPEANATIEVRPAERTIQSDGRSQPFELPPGASPDFVVRNRRDGDRFAPLGLGGSKKLKEFFIDRKVPRDLRDRVPLLLWRGEIVWIAGIAVSEAFRVRGEGECYVARLDPPL